MEKLAQSGESHAHRFIPALEYLTPGLRSLFAVEQRHE